MLSAKHPKTLRLGCIGALDQRCQGANPVGCVGPCVQRSSRTSVDQALQPTHAPVASAARVQLLAAAQAHVEQPLKLSCVRSQLRAGQGVGQAPGQAPRRGRGVCRVGWLGREGRRGGRVQCANQYEV